MVVMGSVYKETSKQFSSTESSSSPAVTTSTSVTETVNGTHEFKIAGYSLSKGIGIGKYIASDTFMVGGYAWAIYFYPDGKSVEDNASYVSLFIALASEGTDVRALFELTLLDQSGRERHKVHSHFGRTLDSGPYTLKYRGSMWWVFFPFCPLFLACAESAFCELFGYEGFNCFIPTDANKHFHQ